MTTDGGRQIGYAEDDTLGRQIGYAEDDTLGGYDWAMAAVYHHQNRFYIIADSGCSCSGPASCSCSGPASFYSERDAVVGPAATLGGLMDELVVDRDRHPRHVKEAFLDAIKTVNDETLKCARSALGL